MSQAGAPPRTDVEQRVRLLELSDGDLVGFLAGLGHPAYRARQIRRWIERRRAADFAEMTDLPLELRQALGERAQIGLPEVLTVQRSRDETAKFLLALHDGQAVETVLMRYEHGWTVCVSSQVGCRMGCTFCASTIGGRVRNLTSGEMLGQVLVASRFLPGGERVGGVVLMGAGEPLENTEDCVEFLKRLHEPEGLGIGYRHMTLSTCGLVPGIDRLAEEDLPITLAVSLHAPDDETRSRIMPINRKYPLSELIAACRRYQARSGRRITFEYILIEGENDRPEHAERLADLLQGLTAHVNLIPANPVPERGLTSPRPAAVERFRAMILARGVTATVRRSLGRDIDAACGQLRRRHLQAIGGAS